MLGSCCEGPLVRREHGNHQWRQLTLNLDLLLKQVDLVLLLQKLLLLPRDLLLLLLGQLHLLTLFLYLRCSQLLLLIVGSQELLP